MALRTVEVTLSLVGAPDTAGQISLLERSAGSRVARALATLAVMWLIAVACLAVPVAHFLLVPGFALGGLFVAWQRLQETQTLKAASGVCPRCAVERQFAAGGGYRDGRTLHCDGCGCQLEVRSAKPRPL